MENDVLDREVDFSNAKSVGELPKDVQAICERIRAKVNNQAPALLPADVIDWLAKQDDNTRSRVGEVIRQLMGFSAR